MKSQARLLVAGLTTLLALSAVGCSDRALPANGQQKCSSDPGRRCPDGFYCASDDTCWKSGSAPRDGGSPKGADGPPPVPGPMPAAVPAPSSRAVVAGATVSESTRYRAIRTVGQAPGGNAVKSSTTYRSAGGLLGATRK